MALSPLGLKQKFNFELSFSRRVWG